VLVKGGAELSGISSTALAIAMIAAFLLVIGGIKLMRARESRGKGVLMLVAAAVLIGNVAIWTA
jgi:high-affinity Fe2+/Pb2+ permease